MRLFGLIGYPLSHSYSRDYFSKKFAREGLLDCRYELFPLQTISELPALIAKYPELEGLNVTIPYKKQVLPFLDKDEYLPLGLEACNCILIRNGELTGYNTDVTGFEKSISPLLKPYHKKALVLGSGGAAAAVGYVLKKLGIEFHIVGRKIHDGTTLTYEKITGPMISESLVIINTTPLGMYPDSESLPELPYAYLTPEHLLFDLIYNPPVTEFLKKGLEKGCQLKNGEEMLAIQAEESWKIWNGIPS